MLFLSFGTTTLLHQLWVLALRAFVNVLIPASVVITADHVRHVVAFFWIKYKQYSSKRAPLDGYFKTSLPKDESDVRSWPRVAVQLPVFNERFVCQALIDAACSLEWPLACLRVQVLDDSTDWNTRHLIDDKVQEWREQGVMIDVMRRSHRQGYKAGALRQGMQVLPEYDYVAVFDADFRPDIDFLLKTVPYLEGNPDISYVQTRWTFSNSEESYLTKVQEIALNYHFKVEQFGHFSSGSFFNFNGTAGVWRSKAISSVGGWLSRTTVEDMDLSLRTYLAGYRAVFLDDVTCVSEVPSSLFAYRKQQHRWTTGPMQLLRKVWPEIWSANISSYRKLELLCCFFGIGKLLTHLVCLLFYCVALPLSMFTPEVYIPTWALLYLPLMVTLSTCSFTMRGMHFAIIYVLFQNAMGLVKLWAILAGLLGLRHANEWVVTTKLGSSKKEKVDMEIPTCRLYLSELCMAVFILSGAVVGVLNRQHWGISLYLFMQGLGFVAFGLNMVDNTGHFSMPFISNEKRTPSKSLKVHAFAVTNAKFAHELKT